MLGSTPYLEEGKAAVEQLEYRKAITALELATQASTLTPEERAETHQLLASSYAAIGRMDLAERSWSQLLARDPHTPAPRGVAPKLKAAFLSAKQHQYPPDFVRLELLPAPAGQLELGVTDPWNQVSAVVLKPLEGSEELQRTGVINHRARFSMQALALPDELRAEALSGEDTVVAAIRVGVPTGTAPRMTLTGDVPAMRSSSPIMKRSRWFVLGAGVLFAGAALALGLSSSADTRSAMDSRYASDAHALDIRAHRKATASNIFAVGAAGGGVGFAVMSLLP